jgi:hypothetical protein
MVVESQNLRFRDFYDIKFSYIPEKIIIKPSFSMEWDELYKYVVFSSDSFNYEEYLIQDSEITIPANFLRAPGVAIHFYGKETPEEEYNYRLSTNFLLIIINGGAECLP